MQWAGSFSLVGHAATTSLSDVYMDRVFVSVCGIDSARGITVIEPEEGLDIPHDDPASETDRSCGGLQQDWNCESRVDLPDVGYPHADHRHARD